MLSIIVVEFYRSELATEKVANHFNLVSNIKVQFAILMCFYIFYNLFVLKYYALVF